MQVKSLKITNVRVFERAEFEFQPGMNLLVGINGAGKSTVLDVLRTMFSQVLPDITSANRRIARPFNKDTDISVGREFLTVDMSFHIETALSQQHTLFEFEPIFLHHLIHLSREEFVVEESRKGEVRHQTTDLEEHNELTWVDENGLPTGEGIPVRALKHIEEQPIVVFFSAHRSVVESKKSKTGGIAAAFADALEDRALYLNEFAQWWRAREELAKENPSLQRLLDILNETVSRFMDGCSGLHVSDEASPTLLLQKNGAILDARQLSDGERSMLSLVFDLSRRLALANPQVDDPLRSGRAVVLIDELDLHLHPSWQRTIADRLTETFPNCQFIATTHSPQIVGEVPPEQIILIENGTVRRPSQSLGMDTNWILRHLMGVAERDTETKQKLKLIEDLIEDENYDEAIDAIARLRDELGDFPELVKLQTRIDVIDFWDDEENEE
ncbi:MAG: AAA family ATPase [Bacteroidetes bacterium]|nr:MAG: AAA family ATPase [Bacteroidota bacterium]